MALPIFSSRAVSVSWAGAPLDGLAQDSFITFSRNSDVTSAEVGADGQLQISVLPDQSGSCTISFQQNSISNQILSDVLSYQRQNSVLEIGDLTVNDPSGGILAKLKNAHIMTAPEVSLGSDAAGSTRDWVFYCEDLDFTSDVATGISSGDSLRISASFDTIINI